MPDKVKPQEFAARIKAKYPEYKDVDDLVLAQKMVEKYPEYADKVDFQTGVSGLGSLVTPRESLEPTEVLRRQTENATGQNGISSKQSSESTRPETGTALDERGFPTVDPVEQAKGFVDEEASKQALYEEYGGGVQTLDYKPNLGFTVKTDGLGSSLTQGISTDQALENASKGSPYQRAQSERLQGQLGVYQNANPDTPLAQPTVGIVGDEESLETRGQRYEKRAKFVYNSLLTGVGNIASGVADLGMRFTSGQTGNKVLSDIMRKRFQDEASPVLREALVNTIGASMTDEETQRFGQEFLTGSLGGLAGSIPAMLGGSARTGLFFMQAYDGAMSSINAADTDLSLSEDAKFLYATGVGAAVGKLEKVGFDRIFGSATTNVAKGATFGALRAAVNEAKRNGTKVTSEMVSRHMARETSSLISKVARGGAKVVDGMKVEAATGASQEIATVGSELLTNVLADKDIFEVEDLAGITERVLMAGAMEAVGGGFMGGAAAIMSSARKSKVKENEVRAGAIEQNLQVEGLSQPALDVLAQERAIIETELAAESAKATQDFNALPEEEQAQATELSERRDSLEAAMADPNVSETVKESIQKQVDDTGKQIDELIPETPTQTIEQSIGAEQGYFSMEGEAGRLTATEGGAVEFLADSGKVYELGSLEDIGEQELPSFGISFVPDAAISVKKDSVTVNGKKYINPQENPIDAITRDKDGRVQSVTLETPEGQKRTFRGSNADVIAREYALQAEPAVDPVREAQEALLPAEKESKPSDGIIRPLAPIVTPEEIEAPTEPQIRVNERESDEVIEQRIREEERIERKLREAPVRPRSEFSTQDEYSRYIAENSNDPDEVAREYLRVAPAEPDFVESRIAEYMGDSKINEQDYARYGDANNLDGQRRGRWIDPTNSGMRLDVAAQELSDQLGFEVTPGEFVDFIDAYGSLKEFRESAKSDSKLALEEKYKQLTGNNLTQSRAENATRRFNESLTDEDIFEMDTDLQELGLTYQDILNYEQFNRETTGGIQENVQQPDNDQSASAEVSGESEAAQVQPAKVKPKTPKALLEKVSEQLAKTGLAKSINLTDTEAINAALGTTNGRNINGYVDADGNVFINQDVAGLSTGVHEFAHIWESLMEKQNPALHAQGMALIQGPDGKTFVDYVKRTQPGLEGDAMYKEALAQAIGDAGATMISNQKAPGKIRDWIKKAWQWIGAQAGISKKTPEQIANMSLQEYSDAVAVDLLSGRFIAGLPNGDIVMPTEAKSEPEMTEGDQIIASFLNKMRDRNNIKYQGTFEPGEDSLSPGEMKDFLDAAREMVKSGMVKNLGDLTKIANSVGVVNSGQIGLVWNATKEFSKPETESYAFKKSKLTADILSENQFRMSKDEYIRRGKEMVDNGLIEPSELVKDILESPRALQPLEVVALTYGRTLVQKEIDSIQADIKKNGMTDELSIKLSAALDKVRDFKLAILQTANPQSAGLYLRDSEFDKEFDPVAVLHEMERVGPVSQETRERIEALGRQLEAAESELRVRIAEIEKLRAAADTENINKTAGNQEPPKKRITMTQARKDAVSVLDALDLSEFGMSAPQFQLNGPIRFSIQTPVSLQQSLQGAIEKMKADIASGIKMEDALEAAIGAVNKDVGEGKWNAMAFRSKVLNNYVDMGHVARAKQPYINKENKIVVPGEFIKGLVSDYRANNPGKDMTIDQMVEATRGALGAYFNDFEVRNAITGYGRAVNSSMTDDDINISTAKSIGRLLSRLEELESQGYDGSVKTHRKENEEVRDLRRKVNDMIESLKSTPEEKAQMKQDKALAMKKKQMGRYIEEVEARQAFYRRANRWGIIVPDGYFAKKPTYDFTSDPEVIRLETLKGAARNKLKEEKFRHDNKYKPLSDKIYDWAQMMFLAPFRAVQAGTDVSSFLIQGGLLTYSNPKMTFGALRKSLPISISTEAYDAYFAQLQAHPYFELARKYKINLQLPNFYLSIQEEQSGGSSNIVTYAYEKFIDKVIKDPKTNQKWKDRFPMTVAEKQYAVFLSEVRMRVFEKAVNSAINYYGLDISAVEDSDKKMLTEMAKAVNDMTMASNVTSVQNAPALTKGLNALFYSFRKLAANFKILAKLPMYTGYFAANKVSNIPSIRGKSTASKVRAASDFKSFMFRELYGRYAGLAMFNAAAVTLLPAMLSWMSYDEEEDETPPKFYNPNVLNPIHSDFMKIKYKDTRVSLFLGMDGVVVWASRIALGKYMTTSDPIEREFGGYVAGFRNKDGWDITRDFFRNKLAPAPNIALSRIMGGSKANEESLDRLAETAYPMWIGGGIEQYKKTQDLTETFTLTALGMFGLAYNTYGGPEFAGANGTQNKSADAIFRRLGVSDYSPERKSKEIGFYDNGKIISKLQDTGIKDEYKARYNEFMTEYTLTRKNELLSADFNAKQVESKVNSMKSRAYKYAEIMSTGVFIDNSFPKITVNGEAVIIPESAYNTKIDLIREFMESPRADVIKLREKRNIKKEAVKKKYNPTDKFLEMEAEIFLFNEANKDANEKMLRLIKRKKITPMPG